MLYGGVGFCGWVLAHQTPFGVWDRALASSHIDKAAGQDMLVGWVLICVLVTVKISAG